MLDLKKRKKITCHRILNVKSLRENNCSCIVCCIKAFVHENKNDTYIQCFPLPITHITFSRK